MQQFDPQGKSVPLPDLEPSSGPGTLFSYHATRLDVAVSTHAAYIVIQKRGSTASAAGTLQGDIEEVGPLLLDPAASGGTATGSFVNAIGCRMWNVVAGQVAQASGILWETGDVVLPIGAPNFSPGGASSPTSSVTIADGADVAEGSRGDPAWGGAGNSTVIAALKAIYGKLAAALTVTGNLGRTWALAFGTDTVGVGAVPFASRSDTFAGTGAGTTVDRSSSPVDVFALYVKNAGAATWTIVLEGSLNGTEWTPILTHTDAAPGDALIVWTTTPQPVLYFRAHATAHTGGGTLTSIILGMVS